MHIYVYRVLPPPPPTPMTFIIQGDAPSMLLGDGGGDAVMCSISSKCSICVDNHIVYDDDDDDDVIDYNNIDSNNDLEYVI